MLSKQAQLEKNVADTKTAFDYAFDAENVAHAALVKARDELGEYLKEQDNGNLHCVGAVIVGSD